MESLSSGKRVLIVEDQIIIALNLEQVLTQLGYRVAGIVTTGEESIEFVRREAPDIVLMDIMLAGELDGISAAEIIRKNFEVPIIYLTAHTDGNSLGRANLTGPYGYIVKPIDERDLYTSIEIALHRFQMDKELRRSELKYRTLFEQSLDPIFIADEEAKIIDVNSAMLELFHYSLEEIIGRKASEFFVDRSKYFEVIELALKYGSVSNVAAEMISSNGSVINAQISVKRYDFGNGTGYQGIIRDITQYKLYLEEILRSRQELKELTTHIERLREQERTDIAREIHDVLGQALTALKLDLSWFKKRFASAEEDVISKLATMEGIINDIITNVRKISSQLRPGILDDLGLAAAIEWQAGEFRKRTGMECDVLCDYTGEISSDKSIALFRIFQECLTNIMKHANATRVEIFLRKSQDCLELIIKDNGRGISPEDLKAKGSYGIIGMK
ncbi:MAG TPA: PAS domain S-box protein, partial [Spirochaetota bacterium]|nr:PAS domain S-box protein [Spirochaetota bacterium]